jgi:2-amino-4-hydroxy-6-hydroxymethyldihydropteridine diphosphokinase
MTMSARAYVGVGANLGDAAAALASAFDALGRLPHTCRVARSSVYRSAPVAATGPDFLNAVVVLDTGLSPANLLQALHGIESEHGRERPYVNAPRTLDLDLLLHGDTVLATPMLTLPHPRLHLRGFVLEPLAEVAPDLVIPGLGPVEGWRRAAAGQAVVRIASEPTAG